MKITIQTPDFKANKKLTDYIIGNVMKLSVFGDRILEARIVLRLDNSNTKDIRVCELKLIIPGNDLFAQKQSSTFEDALLKCIEAVKHRISRWKELSNNGKLRVVVTPLEPEEA